LGNPAQPGGHLSDNHSVSGISLGPNTPLQVLDAITGGTDGNQSIGEAQGASGAEALNALGSLAGTVSKVASLAKVAAPILAGLGI